MRFSGFWGLLLVPLAAAFPNAHVGEPSASKSIEGRRIAIAEAQFNFEAYQLTDVCFDCSRSNATALYACNLKFNWYDPNSKLENNVTSCKCAYSWNWDGVTTAHGSTNDFNMDQYTTCFKQTPTFFEMKVTGFQGGNNVTLDMGHHYKDSMNFTPPWDYPTTYASPQLNLSLRLQDENTIVYYDPGPIFANITGMDD